METTVVSGGGKKCQTVSKEDLSRLADVLSLGQLKKHITDQRLEARQKRIRGVLETHPSVREHGIKLLQILDSDEATRARRSMPAEDKGNSY